MILLLRIFGWPHELLHVLALWLVGRRPESVTRTHVDIPDNLSTAEYVFVAGFPALIFWGGTAAGLQWLFSAPDIGQIILRLVVTVIFATAAFGTLGDIHLIITRVMDEQSRPPEDLE
jgi:hypothetical protein